MKTKKKTSFPSIVALLAERSVEENFQRAIRRATRAYWNDMIDHTTFTYVFSNELEWYIQRAFELGAEDVGIKPDEITGAERLQMRLRITFQLSRIQGFAAFVQENSKANGGKLRTIYGRLGLWKNAFLATRNFARAMCGADGKVVWTLGPTVKHCSTCLKLTGRVYRASQWYAAGVWPQHPELECGGWRCRCSLVPTSAAITPGEVPTIP